MELTITSLPKNRVLLFFQCSTEIQRDEEKARVVISRTNLFTISLECLPFIVPHLVNPTGIVTSYYIIALGLCQRSKYLYSMHFFLHNPCSATKLGSDLPQNFLISSFDVFLRTLNILVCSCLLFLPLTSSIFFPAGGCAFPSFLVSFTPPLSISKHTQELFDGKPKDMQRDTVIRLNISSHLGGRQRRKIFHMSKKYPLFTASLPFEYKLYCE